VYYKPNEGLMELTKQNPCRRGVQGIDALKQKIIENFCTVP